MKKTFSFSIKDIVEIGMLVGLAIILDKFLKIKIGATGGSFNFAMVPLYLISLRHGPFKGFVAGGIVFGLITCLLDGYGLITYPLEYLVSFGAVGLLGFAANYINKLLKKKKAGASFEASLFIIIIVLGAMFIRLGSATLDSVLVYHFKLEAAFLYNITYVIPSAIGCVVVLLLMLPLIRVLNNRFNTSYLKC